jgi:hypothetical protein
MRKRNRQKIWPDARDEEMFVPHRIEVHEAEIDEDTVCSNIDGNSLCPAAEIVLLVKGDAHTAASPPSPAPTTATLISLYLLVKPQCELLFGRPTVGLSAELGCAAFDGRFSLYIDVRRDHIASDTTVWSKVVFFWLTGPCPAMTVCSYNGTDDTTRRPSRNSTLNLPRQCRH